MPSEVGTAGPEDKMLYALTNVAKPSFRESGINEAIKRIRMTWRGVAKPAVFATLRRCRPKTYMAGNVLIDGVGRMMSETPKGDKKPSRDHLFQPGNKIGAAGRPQGCRNKATIALQALLDEEGEQITRKAIEMALKGDSTAMRLVLELLIPPTKERRVNLALPKVTTAADTTAAIGIVLEAVAEGSITPGEGQSLAGLLESQRKALETLALEKRLAAVEQSLADKKQTS